MPPSNKFCTSISCMDGRIQLPIIHWLQEKYNVDFIDTITEPGVDKLFSNSTKMEEIKAKVSISVNKHGSKLILVSGHHDCAGNPVSKNEHVNHIKNTVKIVESWKLPVKVIGAWVNDDWEIERL
ncbi:carbonic anhydrase [Candidatus Nitrosotenuis uzonensis]|nr:carbonic anhydrase [Candidatus Nitrosotenuis uzonensis]